MKTRANKSKPKACKPQEVRAKCSYGLAKSVLAEVEKKVCGWWCVDVAAFRKVMAERGAENDAVISYIVEKRHNVAMWVHLVETSKLSIYEKSRSAEWDLMLKEFRMHLHTVLSAPKMLKGDKVYILDLDSLYDGASKSLRFQKAADDPAIMDFGDCNDGRIVYEIVEWVKAWCAALNKLCEFGGAVGERAKELEIWLDDFPQMMLYNVVSGDVAGARVKGLLDVVKRLRIALAGCGGKVCKSETNTKPTGKGGTGSSSKRKNLVGGKYDALARKLKDIMNNQRIYRHKTLVNFLEEKNKDDILDDLDTAAKEAGIKGKPLTERRILVARRLLDRARKQSQYTK